MNGVSSVPHIERLDFFNGQRLFAEDLQTLDGFNRQMRWLHNQSLHAFGIGSGFAVRGERGDREVTIAPGYAIDNEGREIILLLPRTEPVPPVAGDALGNPQFYDLTVHYPRLEDLEELETRRGLCDTHGTVRRREEPVFCWIELNANSEPKIDKHKTQIASGEKIVLARISVKNCRLATLSIDTRRNVRSECLPYVACGRTLPGATRWEAWTAQIPGFEGSVNVTLGAQIHVDTSSGKFATTPCYTARLVGERFFENVPELKAQNFIIEGFTMVDPAATPAGFTLRILLPRFNLVNDLVHVNPPEVVSGILPRFLRDIAQWSVEWMGVEG